jgi:hypothetical protein
MGDKITSYTNHSSYKKQTIYVYFSYFYLFYDIYWTWTITLSYTAGTTCGAGIANPPRAQEFTVANHSLAVFVHIELFTDSITNNRNWQCTKTITWTKQ